MKYLLLLFITTFLTQYSSGESMIDDKKRVADSAEDICPIKVGEKIPSVNVRNLDSENVDLSKLTLGKKTVLIFYRGGWCPFCNIQLGNLKDLEDDLINLGYQLVAISIDKPEKLKESIDKNQLNYTLLSDSKAEASIAFGLAFKVSDDYNKMLLGYNMNIEQASGEEHHILPVPGVFLLDEDSVIQFEYVNPNYKVRLNEQILLKAAEELSSEINNANK
ncbi:MAG: peroxiredoxin-like family protein [Ignavibacteriaceae bacterium]